LNNKQTCVTIYSASSQQELTQELVPQPVTISYCCTTAWPQ